MSLRVFAPADTPVHEGARLGLDRDESHYLLRVRRAPVGAALEVLDGARRHRARLAAVEGRQATLEVGAPLPTPDPPVAPVELLLGLPDSQPALAALTHACTAGAVAVALLTCERSPGHAPSEGRIERVIRAAQRQCGRPTAPAIRGPMPLDQALAPGPGTPAIPPSYVARAPLAGRPVPGLPPAGPAGARLLIGPEGGFTEAEAASADGAGFRPVSLGPWTLRTETAVVAGLAQLLVPPNSRD